MRARATVVTDADCVSQFVRNTGEKDGVAGRFVRESERMLRIEVDGGVWMKPGAAVAYRGQIAFERRHTLEATALSDALLRETSPLVRAQGRGRLFCASQASRVHTIRLQGEAIVVVWQDLLAFEETLTFKAALLGRGLGLAGGGLVTMTLSGHGQLAVISHGEPLSLRVDPGAPVSTDPHATLAWSADLAPALKTDVTWRSLLRHGGQEPIQMCFDGTGFVIVQPYEDPQRLPRFKPLKQLARIMG